MQKNVLAVIGMGHGISLAVARRFAREGFAIGMMARNEAKLKKLQQVLSNEDITSVYVPVDAADPDALIQGLKTIQNQLGPINAMLYNAAATGKKSLLTLEPEELNEHLKTDVTGALVAARWLVPEMRKHKKGSLMFTGGGLAHKPYMEYASLSIGKAGIRSLTIMLAQALANTRVHVGTVTVTGMVSDDDPKYNPDAIAGQFWKLHREGNGPEIVY